MNTLATIIRSLFLGFILLSNLWSGNLRPVPLDKKQARNTLLKDNASAQSTFFIENQGQFHPAARFLLRAGSSSIYLAEDAIWITLLEPPPILESKLTDHLESQESSNGVALRLSFVGANPQLLLEAFDQQTTRISYLLGPDQDGWYPDLIGWGGVRYRDLYPGVDLVIQAARSFPNWYLDVHEGGDLSAVRLQVQGTQDLTVDEGLMYLATSIGHVRLPLFGTLDETASGSPAVSLIKQSIHGEETTREEVFEVTAPFISQGGDNPAETDGQEDMAYSTYLGGGNWDTAYGIVVDQAGAVYVTGSTLSTDFPTTPGAFDTTANGVDAFVVKLNPQGSALEYATLIGGSGQDTATDISIEGGVAYIGGYTTSTDFPLTDGAIGENDAFVVALNSSGTALNYSTLIGGTDEDYGNAIAVASGQAYLAGSTLSSDFPIDISQRNGEAFVVKFNTNGDLSGGATIGGLETDSGFGIGVLNGEAYLTGASWSINFPGPGFVGNGDVFLAKFNDTFGLVFARLAGGIGEDRGFDIAVSDSGVSYLTGLTKSPDFPVTMGSGTFNGDQDAFLVEYGSDGSWLSGYYLGGSGFDEGRGVAIDGFGGIYLGGLTDSSDFPVTTDAYQLALGGSFDAFAAYLDFNEADLVQYASYLGGTDADQAYSLAIDDQTYVYLAGSTSSSDYPVTVGAYQAVISGTQDAFVSKLGVGPIPAIRIEKHTNQVDADQPPGAEILGDTSVDWTYTVTNTGRVSLSGISVTDDQAVEVTCPKSSLEVNEGMICTASATAVPGQYANIGTVVGTPDNGLEDISTSDPSHYFGAEPGIALDKTINGMDGSQILVGTTLTWAYTVTNPGNVPLDNVSLTDSEPGVTPVYQDGDTNEDGLLDPDETWTYQASGTATAGDHSDMATVQAEYSDDFAHYAYPEASDGSSYFGAAPAIAITKTTSGSDGAYFLVGTPLTWDYTVTNPGNVPLANVNLTDSDPDVTPVLQGGDTNGDGLLDPSETWTYQASGVAAEGAYANTGSVSADYTDSHANYFQATASDGSAYFGARPEIALQKLTDGLDADLPPGPTILVTDIVTWTYQITNTGNITLTNVTLTDDQLGPVSCPQIELGESAFMTCQISSAATRGQYTNTATVTGTPPGGLLDVSASDSSHYFGADPGVALQKLTNNQDVDAAPGVYILEGDPVTWSYIITNTGNITLTEVTLTDDQLGSITCPQNTLAGETSMICEAFSVADRDQYTNTATVSAVPPIGAPVSTSGTSYYFGSETGISLQKLTEGQDAGSAPGVYILEGDPVTWTYIITNTGNVLLNNVILTDDQLGLITCPGSELEGGAHITCTATAQAELGQHSNTATVTGDPPPDLAQVSANDTDYYFGAQTDITIQKLTNSFDADNPPGPTLLLDDTVTWTYNITNTSNITLTEVTLTDDRLGLVTCPEGSLDPFASMTCTTTGSVTVDQYANTATVTGQPPGGLDQVFATDSSHYFGADPGVAIQKQTNGFDADAGPGPYILVGETVTWTYIVSNTGNVPLTGVNVSDDNGTPDIPGDDFLTCTIDTLDIDTSQTCIATGDTIEGPYANTGTITATHPLVPFLTASDPSHYFGATPGIAIQKFTNGEDADEPPGPFIQGGRSISWTYVITNTGNVTLTDIQVTDDNGTPFNPNDDISVCTIQNLAPDQSHTCRQNGSAQLGLYKNIGTVEVTPPAGPEISISDPSHYFGYDPDQILDLQKHTNGLDADMPPGAYILVGDTVTWTYTILNIGDVPLSDIIVTDDKGTPGDPGDDFTVCEIVSLDPLAWETCTWNDTAVSGQFGNLAYASGYPSGTPDLVSDEDPSYYFGTLPGIDLYMQLNDLDTGSGPGPTIRVGDPITLTYIVTNTSNVTMTNVTVFDDILGQASCPSEMLVEEASMICTASSSALPGTQIHTGTATGTPPGGLEDFSASDHSQYFGADPSVAIQKFTNGHDADQIPGIYVRVGDPVTWTYLITNTGNITLTEVTLTDDQLDEVFCPETTLAEGISMTCLTAGTAERGQYSNTATVTALPPVGSLVSDDDTSYYFGADPVITLQKRTNGLDVAAAPGPYVLVGDPVNWSYTITNTSNVTLTAVTLTDDQLGEISCPETTLAENASMICTASDDATPGQYTNVATVSASPPGGLEDVSDADVSYYFGAVPDIEIQKYTNNLDADTAPGPFIIISEAVIWRYTVRNTGNVTLTGITVHDNIEGPVTCPEEELGAGASVDCLVTGTAVEGQYANLGSASGFYLSHQVTASDPSHYLGIPPRTNIFLPLVMYLSTPSQMDTFPP